MRYHEIKPTPPLRPFVECFWTLESDGFSDGSLPERILPDGCVELILNFGDRFLQHVEGERRRQPRNFIVGQMTGPILISATSAVELLGIRFQPGGTRPFLELAAHEITDRLVELGGLSAQVERDLLGACERGVNLVQKIVAVDAFLISRLNCGKFDSRLLALAASIIERRGLVSLIGSLLTRALVAVNSSGDFFKKSALVQSCSRVSSGFNRYSVPLTSRIPRGRKSQSNAATTIKPT